MQSFFNIICAQTDKLRLVRFAVSCAERLTPTDDSVGSQLLEVSKWWLDKPTEMNKFTAYQMAIRVQRIDFCPTAPYTPALYATLAVVADDNSVNNPAVYFFFRRLMTMERNHLLH